MQLEVLNIEGEKTGRSVNLSDDIFGIKPNDHLIYMAVKHYLAGKHRGTHKTKGRSEVQGSTRKLHRQKGTGGSRKGDIKNPLYHGGGRVFGPQPHGYGFKMNRKERDLAKMSALAYKASGEAIRIVEEIQMESPKTKTAVAALEGLKVSGKKILFVTADRDDNLYLSLRNIPKVKSALLGDINTYDIMNSNFLVLSEEAAKILSDEDADQVESERVKKEELDKKEAPKVEEAPKKEAQVKEAPQKEEAHKVEEAPQKETSEKETPEKEDKEEESK